MPKYIWKRYNRFSDLPTPGNQPELIVPANPRRVELTLINFGTGTVYLSEELTEVRTAEGFPLKAGESYKPGVAPISPQNALYAVADSGHDLRVAEILME
jgi:hypothetical protein